MPLRRNEMDVSILAVRIRPPAIHSADGHSERELSSEHSIAAEGGRAEDAELVALRVGEDDP
ncbi:hypothetical protein GCM10027161_51880 [Microbispora hainanensis]